MNHHKLLIVDDDPLIRDSLKELFSQEEISSTTAENGIQALEFLNQECVQVVLADINMPEMDGMTLLEKIKLNHPEIIVILITGYGTIETAVKAIKLGAFDYLTKPLMDEDVLNLIKRALEQNHLKEENLQLRQQLSTKFSPTSIIGQDHKMNKIFDVIDSVAATNATILITGESGTGKTLIAQAIHEHSPRKDKPFVVVSCGALPENLLESELFGHTKGAFTGAHTDKVGKFLLADGGSIFLDEISVASPDLQIKLLRILQERKFESVGSNETHEVDVRVIVATNQELKAKITDGSFREDLYYRINVIGIDLPPLRERIGDISLLIDHFIKFYCQRHEKTLMHIHPKARDILIHYPWPGNVRELENLFERTILLAKGKSIEVADLPSNFTEHTLSTPPVDSASIKDALEVPEKIFIEQALKSNHGNRQKTARMLKVNRSTLYNKMKKYDLLKYGKDS